MGIINTLLGTLFGRGVAAPTNTTRTMRQYRLHILATSALLSLISTSAVGATLDFIDFKKLSDDVVEIRMAFSDNAPQPTEATSKNPPNISFDLPGIKNNLPWNLPLPVDAGVVKNIKAVQTRGSTLVTVNIEELKDYELRTEGKNIFVTIGNETPQERPQTTTPPVAKAKPVSSPPVPVTRPSSSTGKVANLQKATFTSLPGDSVQVRLSFSSPIANPGSFTINNPARIILDFPKTGNALGWKNKNIGIGFAKSITAVEAGDRTRVILNLVQLIPFETEIAGNSVIITLAGSRTARTDTPTSSIQAAASDATDTRATTALHRITNIDFRRGKKGEGRIIVELSSADTPISTGEAGNQIFVEFGNTSLPDSLQQRLDVVDFATPVQYIDTTQSGGRVRLAITPTGDYEYLGYHSGNSYTIEVSEVPKTTQAKAKKDEFGYTGDRLSLNFQDIEARAVLQLIADFTGLNMVTSDSVSGNLTLRLKNVPWDQALDIILKTKGLAMRKTGNVILVAPAQEIAAQEKLELEANKQIEELAPLRTDLIQINYSKAEELAKILESKGGLLSERGEISVDQRTNIMLVTDTGDRLDEIQQLVSKLDIPVRQVMIDSRIVIADDKFAKDLGVRFGVSSVNERGNGDLIFNSGRLEATDIMASSALDNLANGTLNAPYPIALPVGIDGIPQRMNVNMPVIAPNAGAFALSILTSDTLLDLELSALQTEGRGEVLSNPRVITSNQHEALIEQGTEIPYQQSTSSGAASIAFKKAVLSLRVTPQITPDDRIILDLKVNKDSVGQIFAGVPSIDTKAVETQVLINNGETVVLGGVYEQVTRSDSSRVPFFGDLPFIGVLFRNTSERNEKTELLIFVTPKIVKQEFLEK